MCNGLNGTPDLRSRFVYGADGVHAKSGFAVGWDAPVIGGHWPPGLTGGEEFHTLIINEMPAHTHETALLRVRDGGYNYFGSFLGGNAVEWWGHTSSWAGGSQPHNIMPRFMTLAYIMKL